LNSTDSARSSTRSSWMFGLFLIAFAGEGESKFGFSIFCSFYLFFF
jgi:hypothetical protein